jgi:hypothetical protein
VTVPGITILDELYRNGIMVIMTVDDSTNNVARIPAVVDHYKNHPAILMWSIGSEWNINRFFGEFATAGDAAVAVESAAQLVKAHDAGHPVASSYGHMLERPNDIEQYVLQTCPTIDVWSFNEYRGPGFSRLFDQWSFISGKPMFVAEFGIDAYNSLTNQEDQGTHAQWGGRLWDEIARNLSADDPGLTALGGTVFEFNDEWWKTSPFSSQDPGGWHPLAFPDGMASEDWWGIVTMQRTPRQLYAALAARFAPGYQPPPATKTVTYRAVSSEPVTALFWENDAQMHVGTGASLNGGRGFNIAAINPSTGKLRDPIRTFDTWNTRNTGTDLMAMVAYLDSVPNGTILLISAGDELGLNEFPPSDCAFLPFPFVGTALQKLQALGSTRIQDYCYRDQWAMIAIKGQGTALAESLSRDGDAASSATLTLASSLPTISAIPNQTMPQDTQIGPLPVTVDDADTAIASLTLTVSSSNSGLVSAAHVSFGGGNGRNRTLTITPVGNRSGTATLTVTVSDGVLTASTSFVLTVTQVVTVPGAPTGVSAVAGEASAIVSFTPPAVNGNSQITSYTVTSAPGGISASGFAPPIQVNGLTNNLAYTFTVRATNAVGMGPASAPSNPVTPTADATPDAFSFIPQGAISLNATVTSNTITVSGISGPSPISVSGGTYRTNGGAPTADAGTVTSGTTVSVQHTASGAFNTRTCATLTIGSVQAQFCATTELSAQDRIGVLNAIFAD